VALSDSFQEFVASVKAAVADGKLTADEFHQVAREFFDCLAPLAAALEPGNEEAIEALVVEAKEAAADAIDALPDGKLGMKPIAKMAADYAVPSLVRSVAKAGVPVNEFLETQVLPRVAAWETTLHHLRVSLGG
jgi:hypothetical protein